MSFVRQFLVYGIAGAASRLAAVVLVPLYTRTLSIGDYGRLEVFLAVHALIVILAGMQIESAVARDYFDARANGQARTLAWAGLGITVAGSAALAGLLFAAWQLAWLPDGFDGEAVGLLMALTLPAQLFGLQLVMLRFEGSSITFAALSFFDLALCALFSVGFIVVLKLGVAGALWGMLAGKLLSVALAWSRTFGRLAQPAPGRPLLAQMLGYGIPLVPAVLIGWVQNAGSRLLLAIALTLADVALAGIAIKVAAIYGFVVYSFRLAWEPFSMAKLNTVADDPQVYNRALEWYVVTMFIACGGTVLLAPYIVRVLAPAAYAPAGWLAIYFLWGQFWVGVTNVLVVGIHGARLTSRLLPVFGLGALANVALLFALAPLIGVSAAGVGFLSGSIVSALVARHYSNKHFDTRFSVRLFNWTALATVLFLVVWHPVAVAFADATTTLGPALALLGAGACLMAALLALIMRTSLEPGRAAAMWAVLAGGLGRAGRAA
jgi:O-antigen/teichoic acid export membrane protein